MNSTLKSTLAVIAGFLTVVIFSVVTDTALEAAGIFSRPGAFRNVDATAGLWLPHII